MSQHYSYLSWAAIAWPVLLPIAIAVYRLTLHPLAKVPGPKLAAVTSLWQANQLRNGRARQLATTLHKKYGTVVRVAPNEVWFDSKEAVDMIYSAGTPFEKANWYWVAIIDRWTVDWKLNRHRPATLDLFTETDKGRYRSQRRTIGPVLSIGNLRKYEKVIDDVLDRFVAKLRTLGSGAGEQKQQQVDLAEWMHILSYECLATVTMSWSPGQIEAGSGAGQLVNGYDVWRMWSVLGLFEPVVLARAILPPLKYVFPVLAGVMPRSPPGYKSQWENIIPTMVARMSKAGPANLRPEGDILDDIYRVRANKPEFSAEYHTGTITQNFGAGHDTICAVMTAALALSCSDAAVRNKIHEELLLSSSSLGHGNGNDNDDEPTRFDRAKDLEYTQACFRESQRLYPVTAMSLMRRVPRSGLELHGYRFPPGTTVGCNPVAYHQNEAVFGPGAGTFDPGRWLGDHPEGRRSLEHAVLTWGGANRRCPGQHLAQLVCYKAFARLMLEFDIEVEVPPDDEMPSYFLAMMTGVKARFRPRS